MADVQSISIGFLQFKFMLVDKPKVHTPFQGITVPSLIDRDIFGQSLISFFFDEFYP